MKTYAIVSEKVWHDSMCDNLQKRVVANWIRIKNKSELTLDEIKKKKIDILFFPHWSHIISREIFESVNCIVFHMTDLPFGRGGSPLQNLIVRGLRITKISALKVSSKLDGGDIYLKRDLPLVGTAREIFERSTGIMEDMIEQIIKSEIMPKPQEGEVVIFERRTPEQGNLADIKDIEKVYDYIRMLDCEGYPQAFLETTHFRLEFSNATLVDGKLIDANVRIIKK